MTSAVDAPMATRDEPNTRPERDRKANNDLGLITNQNMCPTSLPDCEKGMPMIEDRPDLSTPSRGALGSAEELRCRYHWE
jgi:hypothetical protein